MSWLFAVIGCTLGPGWRLVLNINWLLLWCLHLYFMCTKTTHLTLYEGEQFDIWTLQEVERNRNQWRTDHCKTDYKVNRKNHGVRKYNKVNPLKMEYKRFIRVVLVFKTQFKMRLICLTAGSNVSAMYTQERDLTNWNRYGRIKKNQSDINIKTQHSSVLRNLGF